MVTQSAIQAAAVQIAGRFKPERIILFGSYAYGKANENSDVDFLILMRGRNVSDRSLAIRMEIDFGFPVDLLVRSTTEFDRRIKMGDQFLIDIQTAGKVLYEAADKRVGEKGRGRLRHRGAGFSGKKAAKLR